MFKENLKGLAEYLPVIGTFITAQKSTDIKELAGESQGYSRNTALKATGFMSVTLGLQALSSCSGVNNAIDKALRSLAPEPPLTDSKTSQVSNSTGSTGSTGNEPYYIDKTGNYVVRQRTYPVEVPLGNGTTCTVTPREHYNAVTCEGGDHPIIVSEPGVTIITPQK